MAYRKQKASKDGSENKKKHKKIQGVRGPHVNKYENQVGTLLGPRRRIEKAHTKSRTGNFRALDTENLAEDQEDLTSAHFRLDQGYDRDYSIFSTDRNHTSVHSIRKTQEYSWPEFVVGYSNGAREEFSHQIGVRDFTCSGDADVSSNEAKEIMSLIGKYELKRKSKE